MKRNSKLAQRQEKIDLKSDVDTNDQISSESKSSKQIGLKRQIIFKEANDIAKRNEESLLSKIEQILLIPKSKRSKEEQDELLKYIKQIKVFKDTLIDDEEAYNVLSSQIKVINVEENETLFTEGQEGNLYYIVLSGEVEVLKATQQLVEYSNGQHVNDKDS